MQRYGNEKQNSIDREKEGEKKRRGTEASTNTSTRTRTSASTRTRTSTKLTPADMPNEKDPNPSFFTIVLATAYMDVDALLLAGT